MAGTATPTAETRYTSGDRVRVVWSEDEVHEACVVEARFEMNGRTTVQYLQCEYDDGAKLWHDLFTRPITLLESRATTADCTSKRQVKRPSRHSNSPSSSRRVRPRGEAVEAEEEAAAAIYQDTAANADTSHVRTAAAARPRSSAGATTSCPPPSSKSRHGGAPRPASDSDFEAPASASTCDAAARASPVPTAEAKCESWTAAEDETLLTSVAQLGYRAWATISREILPGRSRCACRNRYRRLTEQRSGADAPGSEDEGGALHVLPALPTHAEGWGLHTSSKSATGYRGVVKDAKKSVRFKANHCGRSLGFFATAVDAAVAYAKARAADAAATADEVVSKVALATTPAATTPTSRRASPADIEDVDEHDLAAAEIMLSARASPRVAPLAATPPAAMHSCNGLLHLLAAAPCVQVPPAGPAGECPPGGDLALPSPSASTEVGDEHGEGARDEETAMVVLAAMRRHSRDVAAAAAAVEDDDDEEEGEEEGMAFESGDDDHDDDEEEDEDGSEDDDDDDDDDDEDGGGGRPHAHEDCDSWSDAEDKALREAVARRGTRAWAAISTDELNGRSRHACRNRWRRLAARRLAEGWLNGPHEQRAKKGAPLAVAVAEAVAKAKRASGKMGKAALPLAKA